MTPLEAIKAIYEELDEDGPYINDRLMTCRLCKARLTNDHHKPDCPWLQMPQIIMALEAAEAWADGFPGNISREERLREALQGASGPIEGVLTMGPL